MKKTGDGVACHIYMVDLCIVLHTYVPTAEKPFSYNKKGDPEQVYRWRKNTDAQLCNMGSSINVCNSAETKSILVILIIQ